MPDTRWTFARKAACAALLIALADWLFYGQEPGWTLGLFALAWTAGLVAAVPALRRPAPLAVLGLAAALGLVLVDDPNPLAWALFWIAVGSAALLPRHRFDDAARWAARLLVHALIGPFRPLRDGYHLLRRRLPGRTAGLAATLALPVAGTLVFGTLFAIANPVIGNALDAIELPSMGSAIVHLIVWGIVLSTVWPTFRPRTLRLDDKSPVATTALDLPVATVTLSLAAFNAIFALQNALDLAFLWSGAALPAGITLADYAHRGAYTLIATALLAGAFVLVALAPRSRASASPAIRRLVILWIAQNVLLVASSILRLVDYIEAYSLTGLRISALAWMVLVAVGLVLVAIRLLRGRSAAWLLNTNALAAAITLLLAAAIDLGAVAARWNVAHAVSADRLDLCYLNGLGDSALLPLVDLERRAGGPALRDRTRYLRLNATRDLATRQTDWHSWTWRGARRLAAAKTLAAGLPTYLRPAPDGRACDGSILPPPAAPLTQGAER